MNSIIDLPFQDEGGRLPNGCPADSTIVSYKVSVEAASYYLSRKNYW
jgi:hypothetical protein